MRYGTRLLLFLFGTGHLAGAVKRSDFCLNACELTLNYVDFVDTNSTLPKKTRRCQSILFASSLYLCAWEYCKADSHGLWLVEKNEQCVRLANVTLPPYDIIRNYTDDDVAGLRRLSAQEDLWNGAQTYLSEVVIPEAAFFDRAFKTLVRLLFATLTSI